jgi:hypothetical protein
MIILLAGCCNYDESYDEVLKYEITPREIIKTEWWLIYTEITFSRYKSKYYYLKPVTKIKSPEININLYGHHDIPMKKILISYTEFHDKIGKNRIFHRDLRRLIKIKELE